MVHICSGISFSLNEWFTFVRNYFYGDIPNLSLRGRGRGGGETLPFPSIFIFQRALAMTTKYTCSTPEGARKVLEDMDMEPGKRAQITISVTTVTETSSYSVMLEMLKEATNDLEKVMEVACGGGGTFKRKNVGRPRKGFVWDTFTGEYVAADKYKINDDKMKQVMNEATKTINAAFKYYKMEYCSLAKGDAHAAAAPDADPAHAAAPDPDADAHAAAPDPDADAHAAAPDADAAHAAAAPDADAAHAADPGKTKKKLVLDDDEEEEVLDEEEKEYLLAMDGVEEEEEAELEAEHAAKKSKKRKTMPPRSVRQRR